MNRPPPATEPQAASHRRIPHPALRIWMVTVALLLLPRGTAAEFDRTHAAFDRLLKAHVTAEGVAYARLKADPADLNAYLEQIAAVPPDSFASWPREDRLSLLLNLYNAETLRLIRDAYPVKSIRSIGVLPGAAWRQTVVRFGGRLLSLDHLENRIIRPEYGDPRIHFALVCAARGCPPLRTEAYTGTRLDQQLDDQARQFLATPGKNRFEPETATLWLSPLFDWYEKDFTSGGGSLKSYVLPFLSPEVRTDLAGVASPRIRFTEYDWSLNDQSR